MAFKNITRALMRSWEDNGRRWPKGLPKPVRTFDAHGREIKRTNTGDIKVDRWGNLEPRN